MTTGTRTQPKVVARKRRNWQWLWIIPAAILASALIGWATTPKGPHHETGALQQSQGSAVGTQGAAGQFSQQLPTEKQAPNSIKGGPLNTLPAQNR